MFANYTSTFPCYEPQIQIGSSYLEGIPFSHGKIYSFDFVSLNMLSPFNDIYISLESLLSLSTIFIRLFLILLYVYWPNSTTKSGTWNSIIWKEVRTESVAEERVNYDYECFDCTFSCASREDMNLHSRLCLLGVTDLNISDAISQN